MKRTLDILRSVLVSPEIVVVLVPLLLWAIVPQFLMWLFQELRPEDFAGRVTLLGIPFALLVGTYYLGYDLLNPGETRKELKAWPEYWRLKLRVWIAFGWALLGSIGTIAGWLLYKAGDSLAGAALLLAGIAVPATTLVTLAIAKIQLRDALDVDSRHT